MTEPPDSIAIARQLADEHPLACLPCPACAVELKAENLDGHLQKVHPGFAALPAPWRGRGLFGLFPCSVAFDDEQIVLRHRLGLGRRTVRLPCALEVGTLIASRPDPVSASNTTDWNQPSHTVRVGHYLRLVGERSITIGCRQGPTIGAWNRAALRNGVRRRRYDLVLPRGAVVAIEYELARRGMLTVA